MYHKDMIKSHLEKRRTRRAHSNIRPRQRFSTISAFQKNDVGTVSKPLQEEGITTTNNSKFFVRLILSLHARSERVNPHYLSL